MSVLLIIGVLFCAVAFGLAANAVHEEAEPFKKMIWSFNEISMYLMEKFLL